MLSTLKEIGNFSVLLLVFIYIYALIGMQTFANQFRFNEAGYPVSRDADVAFIPRANFDTLLWSIVTVFQVRAWLLGNQKCALNGESTESRAVVRA